MQEETDRFCTLELAVVTGVEDYSTLEMEETILGL